MDIKIQNLKKIYNGNTVLDIDNLGVAKGELIGLVGNNGAGKTTLLRLILDLIQADDGFVESNGQKVNESETWKEYTGSYIDGRFLIDFLTPEEYFDFIADVYHIDDETLQERLAQFEGFMHDEIMGTKKYLRDFSQGNRQKIGIIGAMIINPKVLLLDEPFNYPIFSDDYRPHDSVHLQGAGHHGHHLQPQPQLRCRHLLPHPPAGERQAGEGSSECRWCCHR